MAYVSKQNIDSKRDRVKAILKKYKLKGTLSGTNDSTLTLKIKEGALDFIKNHADTEAAKPYGRPAHMSSIEDLRNAKYLSINPYWYHEHHSGDCLAFLKEVMEVLNEGNHDNSDIQSDYFDVGWYVNIKIGQWDKPYVLLK